MAKNRVDIWELLIIGNVRLSTVFPPIHNNNCYNLCNTSWQAKLPNRVLWSQTVFGKMMVAHHNKLTLKVPVTSISA